MSDLSGYAIDAAKSIAPTVEGNPSAAMSDYLDRWKLLAATAIQQAIDEATERLRGELRIRTAYMNNLPFCPDHRDKVKGKPCRECAIEALSNVLDAKREGGGETIGDTLIRLAGEELTEDWRGWLRDHGERINRVLSQVGTLR